MKNIEGIVHDLWKRTADQLTLNGLPVLLFLLAESMCHVRAMVMVSDEASHRLLKPDLYC